MASYDDTATVSGSVVSFSNGADDVPLKSCEVALSPSLDGYSEVDVVSAGKNLVNGTNFTRGLPSTTIGASIETITSSTRYAYIGVSVGGANFTISSVSNNTDYFWNILIYGYTNGVLSVYTNTAVNASKTVDFSGCDYIRLAIGTQSASYQVPTDLTEYGTIQLEVGSTATAYEPYVAPTTHTADLGRTIYGGQVDIVNGTGKETHAKMIFTGADAENWSFSSSGGNSRVFAQLTNAKTNTNTFASNLITPAPSASGYPAIGTGWINNNGRIVIGVDSSITSASDWKTYLSNNNMDIAYELADEYKTDFTFTGQEINTRLGYNAFWSEHGNTELTYYKSGYGFTSVTVHKETPEGEPVVQTAKFHRIVYGGQADVVMGFCEPKNLLDDNKRVFASHNIIFGRDSGGRDDFCLKLKAGTYTFSVTTADGTYTNLYLKNSDTKESISGFPAYATFSKSFTLAEDTNCAVFVYKSDYTSVSDITSAQIEKGSVASEYVPHFDPFTFPPISMETDEGENTLFANEGDSSITYRRAVD